MSEKHQIKNKIPLPKYVLSLFGSIRTNKKEFLKKLLEYSNKPNKKNQEQNKGFQQIKSNFNSYKRKLII